LVGEPPPADDPAVDDPPADDPADDDPPDDDPVDDDPVDDDPPDDDPVDDDPPVDDPPALPLEPDGAAVSLSEPQAATVASPTSAQARTAENCAPMLSAYRCGRSLRNGHREPKFGRYATGKRLL
jgi:hypothetical protein